MYEILDRHGLEALVSIFASVYTDNTPEFHPVAIVPEPATVALLAIPFHR